MEIIVEERVGEEKGKDERRRVDKRGEERRGGKHFADKTPDAWHKQLTSLRYHCVLCVMYAEIFAQRRRPNDLIFRILMYRIKVMVYALDQTLAIRLVSNNMSTSL